MTGVGGMGWRGDGGRRARPGGVTRVGGTAWRGDGGRRARLGGVKGVVWPGLEG